MGKISHQIWIIKHGYKDFDPINVHVEMVNFVRHKTVNTLILNIFQIRNNTSTRENSINF